jgi:adenylosuccinate lyase
MEVVRSGGDRQQLHEIIREHSLTAWETLREGKPNPLVELLSADGRITQYVPAQRVPELLRAEGHIGDAVERAKATAKKVRDAISSIPRS